MPYVFDVPLQNGAYVFDDPQSFPVDAAPSFIGGLSLSAITTAGLTVSYTLDENCTAFLIAVAQGAAVPTPEQIEAGVDYGAVTVLFDSSAAALANVATSQAITGLSAQAGQQITVYVTAKDGAGNLQNTEQVRSSTAALNAVNNPPSVSGNYTQQTVVFGQSLSFDGSANFTDNDALTYSISGITGATINASSGLVSWTPSTTGVYSATITATDTASQSVGAQLPVNVVDAPPENLNPSNRSIVWSDGKSPNFVIGDNFIQTVTLYYNTPTEVCNIVNASSVKVALVTDDHSKLLTGVVDQSLSTVGASWSGGVVVISMGEAVTAEAAAEITKLTYCKLEIEVVLDGNSFTWFAPVRVIPGYID